MTTVLPLSNRYFSLAATVATALTAFSVVPAQAQTYPLKPITLVVPFAPGGGTDSIARDVGKALGDKLGQVVII